MPIDAPSRLIPLYAGYVPDGIEPEEYEKIKKKGGYGFKEN